jgi:hypothetical protein
VSQDGLHGQHELLMSGQLRLKIVAPIGIISMLVREPSPQNARVSRRR